MEHNNAVAQQGATLLSFTEESCWTREEKYREYRIPVAFTLQSVGRRLGGKKVSLEFSDDYGVFYHSDDDAIIATLHRISAAGGVAVDWGNYVFHRVHHKARIDVLCPDSGRPVASITTRRYLGKPVESGAADAGMYGANVVSFAGLGARLAALSALADAKQQQRKLLHAQLREQGIIGDER